ncbi:uncharacterized protein [Apostichopus japonicus]|uniref:uncharacterized protein isoform X4 n=1 Tax=Stichopus japonicus TaxID=307972 RepID=UPI003AB716F4
MEDDRARLEEDFAKTLQDLSEELTSSDIRKLTNLYPKISNKEADKIRKDDDPADCFLRKIKGWELSETNVDGLIKTLEYIHLIKAAGILKRYRSRNTNLINKEIERLEHEKQLVASTASSVPAKSPTSQNGDRTDVKDKLFISFSSKIKERVTELVERIESLVGDGSCWMYTTRNKPGESLPQEIVDAINKADIMLCMINQDYIDSEPCEEEFLLAKKLKKQIILLHLEEVPQPYKKKDGRNSSMQLAATDQLYARMYIEKHEEEFKKVIAKIKECLPGKDANASGKTLVAPGSPSTSGSRKHKCSQDGEEQTVASSASSSTAKSPPSQKGDRTEGQTVASSASSSTAKSPPSQKGDDTEEQTVASSASSSTAKSPPSQKGDHTEGQTVASSASSSTAKSPPSQKGDDTEEQTVASSASSSTAKSPPSQKGDRTEGQTVASSASSSTAKSPPSQKGDDTDFLFVSFSSKNREEVTKLVSKIESVFGVDSCWMYTRRNLPGDYTLDSITAAIKKADIMLCMITKDYIDSEICRDEFNLAKAHKKLIIPLHLEKVKVPYQTRNGGDPGIQLEATKLVYARMYIDNPEPEFQNVIDKIKECLFGRDANDSGETLVAPGSPSTSGSQKRKSSQDGDDSEVKVTRKE